MLVFLQNKKTWNASECELVGAWRKSQAQPANRVPCSCPCRACEAVRANISPGASLCGQIPCLAALPAALRGPCGVSPLFRWRDITKEKHETNGTMKAKKHVKNKKWKRNENVLPCVFEVAVGFVRCCNSPCDIPCITCIIPKAWTSFERGRGRETHTHNKLVVTRPSKCAFVVTAPCDLCSATRVRDRKCDHATQKCLDLTGRILQFAPWRLGVHVSMNTDRGSAVQLSTQFNQFFPLLVQFRPWKTIRNEVGELWNAPPHPNPATRSFDNARPLQLYPDTCHWPKRHREGRHRI